MTVFLVIEVYNSPTCVGWLGMVKAINGIGLWLVQRKLLVMLPERMAKYGVASCIGGLTGQSVA